MTRKNIPLFVLVSLVILVMVFLVYSKYWVKKDLTVNIINQTSECYSDQTFASEGKWSRGNILMETMFETPDPCYRVHSIKAEQQGDRIEIRIRTVSGGVCIQCFGFKRIEYEILSPRIESDINIYVDVEGVTKHHVQLPLLI